MTENWYKSIIRKIHFDMHTPENVENVGKDFDPQAFAKSVKDAGAEAICFFARCAYGWSYYPTNVGLPHPHLKKDVFGEGTRAMKKEGLRVIAYTAIDNIPAPLAEKHPEWCSRLPDGNFRKGHGSGTLACPSRFPRELLIPQFLEIVRLYQVDGFFLDGVYQYFYNICYCESCRELFGKDIPHRPEDPNWRAFRHWQVKSIWNTFDQGAKEVSNIKPDCLMGINWLSSIRWSVPPPESIGYLTGDPPLHNGTFETAFNLAAWAWRDKPADLMNERMLHHWQDFTCRTPETIETEFATSLAGGGKLFIGDLLKPVDVKPDPEVLLLHRKCFDFAKKRENLSREISLKSDIAIVSSPETMRSRGPNWAVDENPLRGAYLAAIEDGLTTDILYDDDVVDNLKRYKTVILAEQPFTGRNAATAIREFVTAGGGLVVIGAIPKAVGPEEPDSSSDINILQEMTGLFSNGEHNFDLGYLLLRGTEAEDFWRDGDDFRPPIPVHGKPAKVNNIKAHILAPLTGPGQTYQIGAMPPGENLENPALSIYNYGKGKVMFCALPIASDFWKRGNPGAKYVLQKMIRKVTDNFTVERVGSTSVQIYLWEAESKTIIHLVSYQADRRTGSPQVIESPAKVPGVCIKLMDPRTPITVHTEPEGAAVAYIRDGKHIMIDVPPFTIHTAVFIDW